MTFNFFQKQFSKKPRIGVLGLNQHCESIEKFSEDDKIIGPTVNFLKRQNLSFLSLFVFLLVLKIFYKTHLDY